MFSIATEFSMGFKMTHDSLLHRRVEFVFVAPSCLVFDCAFTGARNRVALFVKLHPEVEAHFAQHRSA